MSLNVKKGLPAEIKELVLARLDDPSADVRQAALMAAGALQLREAIPRLIQAAGKPDAELRAPAISALCRMPDPRAAALYREASDRHRPVAPPRRREGPAGHSGPVDPASLVRVALVRAEEKVETLRRFAMSHAGDPRKGEEIFFENPVIGCGGAMPPTVAGAELRART